jgi:tetratricopeptide (TPR) repeat protein
MGEDDIEVCLKKARAFFERAEEVAATDNFDYAIEMYLEGLRMCPEALEDGHAPLRKLALIRQGKGGKKPSTMDKFKHRGGKSPLEEMLNASYLMAKDPDNLDYAESVLKACVAGGYTRTAEWIAQKIFEANRAGDKPSLATYLLLKDSYASLGLYKEAVSACQLALDIRPNDAPLRDEMRDLTAQMTVKRGKYDEAGDFRKAIKDKDAQDKLHAQESLVKTADYRVKALSDARASLAKSPSAANVMKLAEALFDIEGDTEFQEALNLLEQWYQKERDFAFKRKQGELRIKRLRNSITRAKSDLKAGADSEKVKNDLANFVAELEKVELEHYNACSEHYPTDLKLKYEYGRCLMRDKQYDEAIVLFQEAQRDPRYRITAMDKTGLCFLLKGWFTDAIDIFEQAFTACEVKDSSIGKDLRYNLARSREANGESDKALEIYRKLAQLDFGYKDVRQRVDKLRNRQA